MFFRMPYAILRRIYVKVFRFGRIELRSFICFSRKMYCELKNSYHLLVLASVSIENNVIPCMWTYVAN